jgi:predicted glutamine amidotransferase
VPAPLGEIPVFLPAGAIVPLTATPAQTLLEVDDPSVADLASTTGDRVVVVASSPLTRDEVWLELPARTMTVFRNGQLIPHAPKSADQRSAAP